MSELFGTVTRYTVLTCPNCEHTFATTHTGMLGPPRCPECGEHIEEADGIVDVANTRDTQGFFECFDCGHTFGYYDAGNEYMTGTPNCPHCSSDNVSRV